MIGATLSHYEILEKLGAGGMGVVYRARDTKLGREVAVKVLPEALSHDPERLSRFEREARLLASLNHPNVATLHGFEEAEGTRFLVMELVEGETLADRIARHPLPIEEALPLFRQIAEGLEAAHEKGIIHRDLKPSNVKLTPEGKVKVLDFGLARTLASPESGSQSESPTVTRSPTVAGVILGTAAYMSPEQARGKALDKRTDVWSFGCCLFEALTGHAAFLGETVSDTIAKILEREPAWGALPGRTPRRIRELLASCLTKDPANRLHDIADVRIEMAKALTQPEVSARQDKRALLTAVAVAVAATAVALWSLTRTPEIGRAVTRTILQLPEGERLARDLAAPSVAISPNGRYVAYLTGLGFTAVGDKNNHLWLRSLDDLEARAIEGGESAAAPVFSPDSEWVGFARERTLLRAAVSGGAPRRIAGLDGIPHGVDWSGDELVFSGEVSSGLFRVPGAGGEPDVLTALASEPREKSHRFPQVLPGGDAVLFTLATSTTESWDDASIAVASMKTGEYKIVLEGGASARYSPTGHLVYARGGSIHAVKFDLENLEVTGRPVQVLEGVMTSAVGGAAEFDLAENGSLLYAPGLSGTEDRRVVSIDRQGRVEPLIETARPFTALRISADGRYVVFGVHACIDSIWLYAMDRGTLTRLTSEWDNNAPVWDPSGREIAVTSARASAYNLYKVGLDGGGKAERLATSDYVQIPTSWSPDGAVLAFHELRAETGADVFLLSSSGDPEPFLTGRADERFAAFSPNGRWIAYQSDETGRHEIYVRRYPGGGGLRQVSTDGGAYPVWNPNGKELFYRDGDKMMAVTVETGGDLVLGRPTVLFERRYGRSAFSTFAVTPDGRRFIDLDDSVAEPAPTHLVLVQNFAEELKRLAPARN
jgi:serine/threonine-protein kinase